jgi:hypothetical protein
MPEAVVVDYGGVVCNCDSGILLAVVRSLGKRKSERVGWRCEKCGAGYTNGFSRDSSLDKKHGRRRVAR